MRPLDDSKKASANETSKIITYGTVPRREARTHPVPTMHMASFLKSFPEAVRLGRKKAKASNIERATMEIHAGRASPSRGDSE